MKTLNKFIFEARGVFNPDQIGKQLIFKDQVFDLVSVGTIDDWDVFKKGKKFIVSGKATPKFYTKLEKGSQDYYLVGSARITSPGKFPGWSWPASGGKSGTIKMKPKDFPGITDKWMKVSALRSALFKAIKARKDLEGPQKAYFMSLFDHYAKNHKVVLYSSVKSNKNSILKDYGEIVGTIWYLATHGAVNSGKVYLPGSGTFPLIDSLILINQHEIKISSKSGKGVSNTIKGKDILAIIQEFAPKERKAILTKYKAEFDVLNAIEKGTVVLGTIAAFKALEPGISAKHKNSINAMVSAKSFRKMPNTPVDPKFIADLSTIVTMNTKHNLQTQAGVLALMSKYIEVHSKSMKFRALADDVINGRVIYLHADSIDNEGIIKFHVSNQDTPIKDAFLRYKGTVTRAADKLGLQIKI